MTKPSCDCHDLTVIADNLWRCSRCPSVTHIDSSGRAIDPVKVLMTIGQRPRGHNKNRFRKAR